jgi:elongation factor G
LLVESSPILLEPFMSVEITLGDHLIGEVFSDITSKRGGRILGVKSIKAKFNSEHESSDTIDDKRKCLNALIPLSEMVGYSRYLRSISKGEAQFVMNFSHYERLSGMKQAEILQNPLKF